MRRWTGSALVQIMACRLSGAKPLSEPVLTNCQLDPKEHIWLKFYLKFKYFISRKCDWTNRLRNGGHFVHGGDEKMHTKHENHECGRGIGRCFLRPFNRHHRRLNLHPLEYDCYRTMCIHSFRSIKHVAMWSSNKIDKSYTSSEFNLLPLYIIKQYC